MNASNILFKNALLNVKRPSPRSDDCARDMGSDEDYAMSPSSFIDLITAGR
jgi:hypothetical protein